MTILIVVLSIVFFLMGLYGAILRTKSTNTRGSLSQAEYDKVAALLVPKRWFLACAITVLIGSVINIAPMFVHKVNQTERVVLMSGGKANKDILKPGLHLVIPYYNTVDVWTQELNQTHDRGGAASKDLQEVATSWSLNWRIKEDAIYTLATTVGHGLEERIILPTARGIVKSVTAQYTAEELVTKRLEVAASISGQLVKLLDKYGIASENFQIINFDFSDSFSASIEAKMTADQMKQKASIELERARIEAEQKVVAAKAEAEALKLQNQAVTPLMLDLRFMARSCAPRARTRAVPCRRLSMTRSPHF